MENKEEKVLRKSDFYYELDDSMIAQTPYDKRDEAKLMILNREEKSIEHKVFKDILDYLKKGDTLVINDTKVMCARLIGKKTTGAKVEVLLLKDLGDNIWEAIVKPGSKIKKGAILEFGDKLKMEVQDVLENGNRVLKLKYNGILNELLDEIGLVPLPPYITKKLEDKDKYQTVYAKDLGSSAAPTAGLHFTEELLKKIEAKGIKIARVTLHVGIGTFRPVKEENVFNHVMHKEHFYITKENAEIINNTKKEGGRIIAVGTTSLRVLETVADEKGFVKEIEDDTGIFIYPGYKFKCIDGLITNFHLPESTLVMLVSALAGREFILNAYEEAKANNYLFFSFGDAMFIY